MKKYGFYIILVMCLLFVGISYSEVMAQEDDFEFSVYAEPSVVGKKGDTVKLKFMISTKKDVITNCKFNVNAPSGVVFVEDESLNGWFIDKQNGYFLESTDGVSEGIIMNSIYEVHSDATITVSNIACGNIDPDNNIDVEYKIENPISVNLKVSDMIVKVDGIVVGGDVTSPLAATKTDFMLAVTSADSNIQSNVKVELADTATGSKQICLGDECKEITVNFSSENFCNSENCKNLKPQLGDHIQVNVYTGTTLNKSFYVIREIGDEVKPVNPTLKYLKVWGYEIELKEGQTVYPLNVPANVTDYTVVAELSDPDNFEWHDEDKPSKYNFKTDTINLRLVPKNYEALGAREEVYVVVITQDGEEKPSSAPSSSSSSSNNNPANSSSSNNNNNDSNISNPQTSGISQFIIAIILFVSLGVVLNLYKKYMEEYR